VRVSAISGESVDSDIPNIPEKRLINNRETSRGYEEGAGTSTSNFILDLDFLLIYNAPPDEGGAKFLRNIGSYKSHTA
jgi:hypothetical protein